MAFVVYVPIYTVLVLGGWANGHVFDAPWREVLFQMAFQGVGSVVISGIGFTKMIQHYGPVRSTMITAVVPGLSAVSAAFVLGELLPWNVLTGLALVSAGIVFGVRKVAARAAIAPVPKGAL
jgi:drug/metabolite transporter (DMT)-like permease